MSRTTFTTCNNKNITKLTEYNLKKKAIIQIMNSGTGQTVCKKSLNKLFLIQENL